MASANELAFFLRRVTLKRRHNGWNSYQCSRNWCLLLSAAEQKFRTRRLRTACSCVCVCVCMFVQVNRKWKTTQNITHILPVNAETKSWGSCAQRPGQQKGGVCSFFWRNSIRKFIINASWGCACVCVCVCGSKCALGSLSLIITRSDVGLQ